MIRQPLAHVVNLSKHPRTRLRIPAVVVAGLALLWFVFVLTHYYLQLWQLLAHWSWTLPTIPALPELPYARESLNRAIDGLGSMALLMLSATLLGLGLGRGLRWNYESWGEQLPVAAALGIGCFAYLGLALTAFGWYRPSLLWLLIALPLLAAGLWLLLRGANALPSLALPCAPQRSEWLWLSCITLAAAMTLIAALAPEREYDALWYHLAYPQRFLAQGRLVDLPHDYVSLYPMTWELWFGYGLAFGGQTAATLLHFACLPLTAIVVYQIAQRYVPEASPWLAVALFVTIPTVMWEASTAYIDLALAFHTALIVYSVLRYAEQRQRQWLLIAALNLSLALATKHLALVILGITCIGLVLLLWYTEHDLWRALKPAVALGCLSLILPLPWYLRSFLASGNPVFPELYSLFGAPSERWTVETERTLHHFLEHFGPPRTFANLVTLPWHMTIHAAAYHGALGPLFLLLLPLLVLGRATRYITWLCGFVVLFVMIWASPLASFQMRFLMPITPLLAVLGAAAYSRLATQMRLAGGRVGLGALHGTVGLLLLLNLPPFTPLHEHDRVEWDGWLNSVLHGLPLGVVFGSEGRGEYLGRTIRSYNVWQFANQALPQDARVLTESGGDELYTHPERIWTSAAEAWLLVRASAGREAYVLHGLKQLGITHVIVERRTRRFPDDWDLDAFTGSIARAHWYETMYEDHNYVLYRLRWEALDRQEGTAAP